MSAAATYADHIDAINAQLARIGAGRPPLGDVWGGTTAGRFREDPRRPLDPVLEHLAGYLRPNDVFLDIGGGAGRMSLPLASRCAEVVDVEPSAGMGEAFVAAAAGAGIANARWLQAAWPDADSAEPALKPNQPNHNMPVPRITNGMFAGVCASPAWCRSTRTRLAR